MGTTIYRRYTLVEKLNHINNIEKSDAPRSTAHSWRYEARESIEQLAKKDGLLEMVHFNKQLIEGVNDAILHTIDFFMTTVHQKKSLVKQYKKQRVEWLNMLTKLKRFIPLEELLTTFDVSRQTHTNLQNKLICNLTPSKTCLNSALNQIPLVLVEKMQRFYFKHEAYSTFSLSDLFARLRHDKHIFVSYSKFREIAIMLGEDVKRKRIYTATKKVGRRANAPNELIHADKTVYKLKNGRKAWIYIVCDNYSRKILATHVSFSSKSKESLHTLKLAIKNNELNNVQFEYLTDDGSENKHLVREFINTQPNITHLIAQTDAAPYSNSMIEAINKYFKNDILLRKDFNTIEELETAVSEGVAAYNNRHRKFLSGGTPNDFYSGNEPNLTEYRELYKDAQQQRMQDNKEFNCLRPCPSEKQNFVDG